MFRIASKAAFKFQKPLITKSIHQSDALFGGKINRAEGQISSAAVVQESISTWPQTKGRKLYVMKYKAVNSYSETKIGSSVLQGNKEQTKKEPLYCIKDCSVMLYRDVCFESRGIGREREAPRGDSVADRQGHSE